ncbi:MAG: hypothetical protein K0U37_01325 [Gammaproteobacteria bacterium]|nr:hypothetical protein [Gammaproteobacteria bacterium]
MSVDNVCTPGGLQLDFFPPGIIENENNAPNPEERARIITRKALRILMMGWPKDGIGELASWELFQAVFVKRDANLLKGMRYAFQEGFHHIYEQLKNKNLTEAEQAQAELYLSNCLSVLPFSDITPHESIEIPQYINGEWDLVDYKVVPIELTPTSGVEKVFLDEGDRVFAYGLEPINHDDAEPHLIFMGTTYPAGQGFSTQVHTDFEGFETAGKKLYRTGRERIIEWLDKQPKKAHACGMSLGGSLSLLLAIDVGDKLSRVDALNPPGLYTPWRKSQYDNWDTLSAEHKSPPVYIQKQANDPVSAFGDWKKGFNLFHITPPKNKQGPNGMFDHALNYAGFADSQFVPVDAEADNKARRMRNNVLYIAFRSMIYYGVMLPYRYLIQPILRCILNHLLQIALLLAATIILPHLPTVVSAVLLGVAALITACYLFDKLVNTIAILRGTNQVNPPAFHEKNAPRNESLDIYQNNTTATFSVKQLGDYHYAKHSLFFKADNTKLGGLSRQEILEKSLNPVSAGDEIEVTVSKAKMHDIKRTLGLIHHKPCGKHYDNTALKSVLEVQEEMYEPGFAH